MLLIRAPNKLNLYHINGLLFVALFILINAYLELALHEDSHTLVSVLLYGLRQIVQVVT